MQQEVRILQGNHASLGFAPDLAIYNSNECGKLIIFCIYINGVKHIYICLMRKPDRIVNKHK